MIKHISFLILAWATAAAATNATIKLKHVSLEEIAETVLPDDAVVYVKGSNPVDVRIGDNLTVGGLRVGDGNDPFDYSATQDLMLNGHKLVLGDGYELYTLGGWGFLSGGEVGSTNGAIVLSVYGTELVRAAAGLSLSQVLSWRYDPPYFVAEFLLGDQLPTLQSATSLISQDWSAIMPDVVSTNGTSLIYQFEPSTNEYLFYRAVIPDGTALVTISAGLTVEDGVITADGGGLYNVPYASITNPPTLGSIMSIQSGNTNWISIANGTGPTTTVSITDAALESFTNSAGGSLNYNDLTNAPPLGTIAAASTNDYGRIGYAAWLGAGLAWDSGKIVTTGDGWATNSTTATQAGQIATGVVMNASVPSYDILSAPTSVVSIAGTSVQHLIATNSPIVIALGSGSAATEDSILVRFIAGTNTLNFAAGTNLLTRVSYADSIPTASKFSVIYQSPFGETNWWAYILETPQ